MIAPLWLRVRAQWLDALVVLPAFAVLVFALATDRAVAALVALAAIFIAPILIELVGIAFWGRTPGRWIARVRVVTLDGEIPGWSRAVDRVLGSMQPFSEWHAVGDPQNRTKGDRAAGTIVVMDYRQPRRSSSRGGDSNP